jgi:arylsulfatase A-like enzyme
MRVLVLDAPALHLGYVGAYGNEWIETPNLDRLAAEGVVFDQHYADNPAPGGGPGHGTPGEGRTCFTGRYRFPSPEGEGRPAAEEPGHLAGLLKAHGIPFIPVRAPGSSEAADLPADAPWELTWQRAVAALDGLASRERWLVWIDLPTLAPPWRVSEEHLLRYFGEGEDGDEEPLTPWTDPPAGPLDPEDDTALERLQNTYAAAVTALDEGFGLLREGLERSRGDQVLICFTGSRGLALGERGVVGECGRGLHEELIHLPLILRLSGAAEAGRRISALTQPVDLLPTLLEAFDIPVPAGVQGRSLWPLVRGEAEQVRSYACSGERFPGAVQLALRTPEWAFLLPVAEGPAGPPGRPQLYVKPDDRWEVNDVLQHHLDLAEHLEQVLRGFVEATRRPGPLEPPQLRDIEAEAAPSEPDPVPEPEDKGVKP